MGNNNFKMDTGKSYKKNFLDKTRVPFNLALFLTGVGSINGILFIVKGIMDRIWLEMGMAGYAKQVLLYLSIMCISFSLVKMLVDEKPFSMTLTYCMRIIAVLFMIGSVVLPRLQGYRSSGFEFFSNGEFVLIDAAVLMPGVILYVFSVLVYEGFAMQKEIDEML